MGSVYKLIDGPICTIDQLKAEKEIKNIEHSFIDSSGTQRFLLINAKVVAVGGGTVLYVMRDISDLKRVKEEIHQAEQQFTNFLANVPGVAFQFCLNGQGVYSFHYINNKCEFFFGFPAAEITKNASLIFDLIPEPDRTEVENAISISANTLSPYLIEHRIVKPDGKTLWIKASSTPRRMVNGDIVWDGIGIDITDLKMIQKDLEAAETRYRKVVEDQTELISRFSADGKFRFVNEAYCRFFDKKPHDLIGSSWKPVALEVDHEQIEQQLSQLSPNCPVVVIENRVYKDDGNVRWIQFINRGLFDSTNNLLEIQSVGRDITELKEIQLSLQEKDHELSEKNSKLEKLNIALEVVIDQKNYQLENLRSDIIKQYISFVQPHLKELKDASQNWQDNRYLKLIDQGMTHILSPFAQHLMSLNHLLSPMELQVASLVKSGMSISSIAQELNISPHTVKDHRKNIRSKLGIQNKKINLRSYLLREGDWE